MNINMDSFVSKLRNTVSQVAYQVNNSVNTIIPGNLIHREYETLKLRCTHGCPGFVWSVYDAVKRDSASIKASLKDAIGPNLVPTQAHVLISDTKPSDDKQLYSVFVFDKSQLDSLSGRADREVALEHIKKGVTQLTRLRHPAILTVHHPIEESRSSLAFVTEHVYGNLASILKEQRTKRVVPHPKKDLVDLTQDLGPKDSDYLDDSCQLDEVQIKAGLLQVCDGLKFLHNDAKILHRNLCLDNIFVDSNNTWKIAGFDFSCQQSISANETKSNNSINDAGLQIVEFIPQKSINLPTFPALKTIYPPLPTNIVPNWSCTAPEHSNSDQVSLPSDVYSLGIISCALLGRERDMIDLSYEYGLISDTYKRGIHFRELADKLPANIKTSIMKYAAINVDSRPSLDDYVNLSLFDDQQVQAIRDLDSQFAWDRLRKIDFFNRLREVLPKLSHQVKVNRIAKSLFNEVVNPEMMPYVLPSILIIAKDSTPSEFKSKIFPNLRSPFRVLEPRSVPLMLLDNMAILADRAKLCLSEFQQLTFTLIQYLLRMDQTMQEKCLVVLSNVRAHIDAKSLSEIILPEINRIMQETTIPSLRVKCLDCLASLVESIDGGITIRGVLPIVLNMPSREADVVMAATGVIKMIANNSRAELTKEIIACKLIPVLVTYCVEKDLNLQQFSSLMSLIKGLLERVEREQRELLAKRPASSLTSTRTTGGPLMLDNFKGSSHFQLD